MIIAGTGPAGGEGISKVSRVTCLLTELRNLAQCLEYFVSASPHWCIEEVIETIGFT